MIRELRPKYPRLPVVRMAQLLGVPRSLVYRKPCERPERAEFYRLLKLEIAQVLHVNPGYGYRRVRLALAQKEFVCGYKSVRKAMKEAGLQARRRKSRPRTSDGLGQDGYPNLFRAFKPSAPNQVWLADITYLGLPHGLCYLAVVIDACARKVIGWRLGSKIDTALTLGALEAALAQRNPAAGWIHHSDRGSQYLSWAYVSKVESAGGRISVSARGCPYDNAIMESFFKTLKAEEVWLDCYESLEQARERIGLYIEGNYNAHRLHSSLGYQSPDQYEASYTPPDSL
jgi:putative transposase